MVLGLFMLRRQPLRPSWATSVCGRAGLQSVRKLLVVCWQQGFDLVTPLGAFRRWSVLVRPAITLRAAERAVLQMCLAIGRTVPSLVLVLVQCCVRRQDIVRSPWSASMCVDLGLSACVCIVTRLCRTLVVVLKSLRLVSATERTKCALSATGLLGLSVVAVVLVVVLSLLCVLVGCLVLCSA